MKIYTLVLLSAWCTLSACAHCSVEDAHAVVDMWRDIENVEARERRWLVSYSIYQELVALDDPVFKKILRANRTIHDFSYRERASYLRIQSGMHSSVHLLHNPALLDTFLEHINNIHKRIPGMKGSFAKTFVEVNDRVFSQLSRCYHSRAWKNCGTRIASRAFKDIPD